MLINRPNLGYGRGTRAAALQIDGDYERSSMIASLSSVTGDGDSAVVLVRPMPTISQSGSGWIEHGARLTGAMGKRPTIRVTLADSYFSFWESYSPSRKGMWSVDRRNWYYFDTCSVNSGAGYVEMRHNTAFPADTIYLARSRQLGVHDCGDWIAGLLASYPTMFKPAASAVAYSPGSNLAGFGAQSLIANEFSSQTQLYYLTTTGNTFTQKTIPPTPLYAVEIDDPALTPPGGTKDLITIVGGVHAGEDFGDYSMIAFVEYLLGASTEAQYMRQFFKFLLYPLANAPGRAGGHFRSQFQRGTGGVNDDINRNFTNASAGFQTNDYLRAAIDADRAGVVPKVHLDFHGTYLSNGFNIVEDAGVALHATYKSTLASFCGFSIGDDANTPTDSICGYFRGLGTPLYITTECGDQTTQADSKITTHGQSIVKTLAQMDANGDF